MIQLTTYKADITVRITKVFTSVKENDPTITLSAVRVHNEHHTVLNKANYYTIKLPNTIFPEPSEGEIWSVTGDASYEEAASFDGNYFIKKHHVNASAITAKLILSNNPVGFKSFIADTPHFKGVGISTAERLWQTFSEGIYKVLEEKDLAKLLTVKHLGKESAISLITGYEKFSFLKHSKFFTTHEIPSEIQKRIYKFKGINDRQVKVNGIEVDTDPAKLIKETPYSLSLFGMTFQANDKLAKTHFNVGDKDKRRLFSAVTQCLRQHAANGHTVASKWEIRKRLKALLHCDELVNKALSGDYDKKAFIIYPDSGKYQFTPTFIMENVVAKRFLNLHAQGEKYDEAEDAACVNAFSSTPFPLEPQQKESIMTSVSYAISCITGGAGTGKTTANILARTIEKKYHKAPKLITEVINVI